VIRNILFLCIGNICRSPMAEGLFRQAMPAKAVCSAGIHAMVGDPADPLAVQLMRERGIDIGEHRAQQVAEWMVKEADLIMVMDREQKQFIERRFPNAAGKVWRLGEHGGYDVPDPYLHGPNAFRHAFALIELGVDNLVERIAAVEQPSSGERYSFAGIRGSPLPFPP
jgi:protein-tyrosine phosphatase